MKKLIFISLALFSSAVAAITASSVTKISCGNVTTSNIQCKFQVKGQELNKPDSVSYLYGITNMPYALCSTAICDVSKSQPDMASCTCKVFGISSGMLDKDSTSVGPHEYSTSQPEVKDGQLQSVTSNFSFANVGGNTSSHKGVCKSDQPLAWANCFGIRCKVSDQKGQAAKAVCECPIIKTKEFISIGPQNEADCKLPEGKVWSGATNQQGENDKAVIESMYQAFN
ncbi:MAG TPA: hypothetical protein VL360_06350 [Gammaproteobacteria bacterium]|nr:hypothetical protein [Gammaproteobacteria bacterium]